MYRPEDSRHFKADQSSTFVPQSSQTFDLNYADGSHLRGFSGVDQVYMGDYKATSPFGTPTIDNPANVGDGVWGFVLPRQAPDACDPSLVSRRHH
jgi:hypothetical protein